MFESEETPNDASQVSFVAEDCPKTCQKHDEGETEPCGKSCTKVKGHQGNHYCSTPGHGPWTAS